MTGTYGITNEPTELDELRAEYPGWQISREQADHRVSYVARRVRGGVSIGALEAATPAQLRVVLGPPSLDTGQPEVDQPKHQLHALTTHELHDYRRQLESAIAFFDRQDPVPLARDRLQASLDAVLAEQEGRKRPADAR